MLASATLWRDTIHVCCDWGIRSFVAKICACSLLIRGHGVFHSSKCSLLSGAKWFILRLLKLCWGLKQRKPLVVCQQLACTPSLGKLPLAPYWTMTMNGVIWTSYGLLVQQPSLYLGAFPGILFGLSSSQFITHCLRCLLLERICKVCTKSAESIQIGRSRWGMCCDEIVFWCLNKPELQSALPQSRGLAQVLM